MVPRQQRCSRLLGAALFLTCGVASTPSFGAEAFGAGPFVVRDQNPFLAGFGLPAAMPARLGESNGSRATVNRGWTGRMDLSWGSTALIQQSGSESLVVDAETREARATLQLPLSQRFSFQLQLPYRYTGAGNLDGFIDGWHDTFGLPEGARRDLPSDQINIAYTRAGQRPLSMTSSASGLADIEAALGYEITSSPASALTAWLSVKLPTGDEDKLTSSGATDASLVLAGQRRLNDRWSAFGQASLTWLGDGEILPAQQRSTVWSGLAGLSWRVWHGLALKAQVDAHSAAFDSDLGFLNEAVVLTVGGDYHFASGWRLDLGVSEDIAVEHSPDVVFVIGVKRGW
jgi:hypothetical protein